MTDIIMDVLLFFYLTNGLEVATLERLGMHSHAGAWERDKQALAERLGVQQEQITLGNGSNDILDMIARVFLCQGREAIFLKRGQYPLF